MNLGELSEVTYELTQSQLREIEGLLMLIILPKAIYYEDQLRMANNVIKTNQEIAKQIMDKLPRPPWEKGNG